MSLRTQLTLAFLVLTLVPSAVVSITALRQLVLIHELWDSAGVETFITSSERVARESLTHLQYDLEHAGARLLDRWSEEPPELATDPRERLYVQRFLEDVGFDFLQVYRFADGAYVLEDEVVPEVTLHGADSSVTRPQPPDLSEELAVYDATAPGREPLESARGAYAYVRDVAGGQRVAVGYLLGRNFFINLFEMKTGTEMVNRTNNESERLRRRSLALLLSLLAGVAVLAVLGGWTLSRRLAGPVVALARRLDAMTPGPDLPALPDARRASPEVRKLTDAFNALSGRLRATHAELLRAERAAGTAQVARHVAHEIKNPLSTLGLATRRLERRLEALPEDERKVAQQSLAAMRAEFEILEEMADIFAELGRMAEPTQRRPLDLNDIARSVAALHAGGPARFDLELSEPLPRVLGDERALRRVLSNLVKNAIEAQDPPGALAVRTQAADGRVILEVEDQGPGIPPEVMVRVFEAGFTTKARGSGVGLFLARAIVEQHGGRIRIDTEVGRGTRVRVELPAA